MRLKCVIVTRQVQTALTTVPLNLIEVVKVGRVRLWVRERADLLEIGHLERL